MPLWRTSECWKRRAAGARRHAKYKERSDVRARRITAIEAEQRKTARDLVRADAFVALWQQLDDGNCFIDDSMVRHLLADLRHACVFLTIDVDECKSHRFSVPASGARSPPFRPLRSIPPSF